MNSGLAVAKALAAREWMVSGEGKRAVAPGQVEGSFEAPMKRHGTNRTDRTNVAWSNRIKPNQTCPPASNSLQKARNAQKILWLCDFCVFWRLAIGCAESGRIRPNPTKSDLRGGSTRLSPRVRASAAGRRGFGAARVPSSKITRLRWRGGRLEIGRRGRIGPIDLGHAAPAGGRTTPAGSKISRRGRIGARRERKALRCGAEMSQ